MYSVSHYSHIRISGFLDLQFRCDIVVSRFVYNNKLNCKTMDIKTLLLPKRVLLLFIVLAIDITFTFGQITIEMTPKGNVYSLSGKINGLELNFIFDTGASDVYLSMTEAIFMLKNGYLAQNDFTGISYSQIANGEIVENTTVLLREVEIGGIKIQDVTASISHNLDAPLLLGQSVNTKIRTDSIRR